MSVVVGYDAPARVFGSRCRPCDSLNTSTYRTDTQNSLYEKPIAPASPDSDLVAARWRRLKRTFRHPDEPRLSLGPRQRQIGGPTCQVSSKTCVLRIRRGTWHTVIPECPSRENGRRERSGRDRSSPKAKWTDFSRRRIPTPNAPAAPDSGYCSARRRTDFLIITQSFLI